MRHFITHACLLIALLSAPFYAGAQANDKLTGYGLEVNTFAGHVIKHSPKFHLPLPDLSTGVDINMVYKCSGRKQWEGCRKYPTLGLGFTYTNYGIDSVYGRCFSLYPNLTIPLITGKKIEWTIRIGDGIGYVTKKYSRNPISDTLNNAIGSHINDYASFNTDFRYKANKHWDFQIGMNFTHISDASYHQPNLGINLYGAHVGIRYFPVSSKPEHLACKPMPSSHRILLQARLGIAFNQIEAPQGPTYPVYLTSLYASRRWKGKNKMYAGLDYLVQKEKGPIKEFFLTGFLKTHKSVAELAEFGCGFGF